MKRFCDILIFSKLFLRPMINHKAENRISGNPPEILQILKDDSHMSFLKQEFENVLKRNFVAVKTYCKKFENIPVFFKEDMEYDENIIKNNKKCDIFRKWCNRYQYEVEEISKIQEEQPLGIFLMRFKRFKTLALPAPNQKWTVLEGVMPG